MEWLKKMKELQAKMQEMLAAAKAESRSFTAEENTTIENLQKDFDNAKKMAELEAKVAQQGQQIVEPVAAAQPRIDVGQTRDKLWNSTGEFLVAVKNASKGTVDSRLFKNAASGMNETVPSEGGFLVNEELEAGIKRLVFEKAAVASRCKRSPIGGTYNGMKWIELDESSRVAGSRHGGILGYWQAEAGTVTATKPKLRKRDLELEKLMAIAYVTSELLEDSVALESEISSIVSDEFAWKLDDAIFASGTGAGMPQSLLNSDSIVSVAKESGQVAATIVWENVTAMWQRMWAPSRANSVWFINQDCEEQLMTMAMVIGTGGVPVYMPANGASGSPYATLLGRPVVPIEQAKTCGTVGDIVLADMSQYRIIEKGGMQSDASMHVRFLYDEMTYRFTMRINGAPIWAKALTPANGTNTLSPFISLATRA